MNETHYFGNKEAANRYVRALGLMGFTEMENTPNDYGGRMVVYRGTQQQLGQPIGPLFVVLMIFTVIGLLIWVLWRLVSSNRTVLRTVIYRPAADPARDDDFDRAAARTAKLPEVKRLVAG